MNVGSLGGEENNRTSGIHGVDDGFRIAPDLSTNQQICTLSSANQGKTGKTIRKSATGCNQDSEDPDPSQADGGKP